MIYLTSILLVSGMLVAFAALLILAERRLLDYGPCTIEVEGRPEPVVVPGGQDLLSALAAHDVHVPSLCGRRGTCGYCRITVLDGAGPVLPTELLYLSADELRRGTRLACQLKVRENLRIRVSPALLWATRYRARVAHVLALTDSLRELRLRLVEPQRIDFSPGQYIQVEVPIRGGEPLFRAYSLASPTYETAEPALDVERVPGGSGSAYLHALAVGDEVAFTGPYGDFRLSPDPAVEIVCVAGGCGLAPMKSIIYTVLDRWPGRPCWLFYGFRDAAHAFHLVPYQRLAGDYPQLRFFCAVSDSRSDALKLKVDFGPVHEIVDRHLPPGPCRQAFICGPPPMVEAVSEVLRRKGVSDITSDRL